jgi:hypothetical protein
MSRCAFRRWLLLPVMLVASIGAGVAHAEDAAAGAAAGPAIVVVPLEPPPLTFMPGIRLEHALAANTGAALSYAGAEATAEAGRALYVVSGIVMLASLPEQTRRLAKQAESVEALLNAAEVWVPTVALAEEARALLSEAGVGAVRVSDELRPVPGIKKRERTTTMHNWYGPIKDWYQLRQSPFEYGEPEVATGDWVLEVGLGNYELGQQLVLLVYTKLVDPGTGKVMKKASQVVYPEVADAQTLLAGDASGFKETFAKTARKALRSNLRGMGLLPK